MSDPHTAQLTNVYKVNRSCAVEWHSLFYRTGPSCRRNVHKNLTSVFLSVPTGLSCKLDAVETITQELNEPDVCDVRRTV